MVVRKSWAVQQVSGVGQQTVVDGRLSLSALVTPNGFVTSRAGLIVTGEGTPANITATSPTPDGFVHVSPFRGVIQSGRAGGGGTYIICADAIEDIDVLGTAPADPTNPRIDLVVIQQSDAYHADVDSDLELRHVVGTPAAVPVDPAVDGSPDYLPRARITVPAGATTITQADIELLPLPWTVAAGGKLPISSASERDAIPNPWVGMQTWRSDQAWTEVWDGSAWRVTDVAICTSVADRDATITNPRTGQLAQTTDYDILWQYNGAASAWEWLASQPVFYDTPAASGNGANASYTSASSVTHTIASLSIADPGYPYRLSATAGMRLSDVSHADGYVSHSAAVTVDTTVIPNISSALDANTLTAGFLAHQGPAGAGAFGFVELKKRRGKTTYTGAHTAYFLFSNGSLGATTWGPLNSQADYWFQVDVEPAG